MENSEKKAIILVLCAIGLSSSIVLSALWWLSDAWLALYLLHVVCFICLPLAYYAFVSAENPTVICRKYVDYCKSIPFKNINIRDVLIGPNGLPLFLFAALAPIVGVVFGRCPKSPGETSLLPGFCSIVSSEARRNILGLGFNTSIPVLLIGAIYFVVVNPILEQLFWRMFLFREFGKIVFPEAPLDWKAYDKIPITRFLQSDENTDKSKIDNRNSPMFTDSSKLDKGTTKTIDVQNVDNCPTEDESTENKSESKPQEIVAYRYLVEPLFGLRESLGCAPNEVKLRKFSRKNTDSFRASNRGTLALSMAYAFYHVFVIWSFFGFATGLLSFICLTAEGFIMQRMTESKRFGIVGSVVYHAGLDFGVAVSVGLFLLIQKF